MAAGSTMDTANQQMQDWQTKFAAASGVYWFRRHRTLGGYVVALAEGHRAGKEEGGELTEVAVVRRHRLVKRVASATVREG